MGIGWYSCVLVCMWIQPFISHRAIHNMSSQFQPVRIRRSRVFEAMYDRYFAEYDESPFREVLPPEGLMAINVQLVVVEAWGLPEDVALIVMGFYRVTRVEKLAVHLLTVVLDAARMEEEFWLQRCHYFLRNLRLA